MKSDLQGDLITAVTNFENAFHNDGTPTPEIVRAFVEACKAVRDDDSKKAGITAGPFLLRAVEPC